jgi:hypothetical protein
MYMRTPFTLSITIKYVTQLVALLQHYFYTRIFLRGMSKSLWLMILLARLKFLLAHLKFYWCGFLGKSCASKRPAPAKFSWRAPENAITHYSFGFC